MPRVTQPTIWHRLTLEKLSGGWELVVLQMGSDGFIDESCCLGATYTTRWSSSKLRQMQFMARRGWVKSVNDNWEITEEGRKYMVFKV